MKLDEISSQELYSILFSQSPYGMMLIDDKMDTVDSNKKACEILGYSKENLNKLNARDIIHPADMDKISVKKLFKELENKSEIEIERRYKKADGAYIQVRVCLKPLNNNQSFLVIFQDISDQKQIETALEENEKKYRNIFENAADAIFFLEAEGENAGNIVDVNKAAADMHGYTKQELTKMNIKDLDVHDDADQAPDRIKKMLSGERLTTEILHTRKDGSRFPVSINAGILDIGDKKYILAFDRDISEQIKNRNNLKEQIAFFQMLIDTIPSPIFYKDAQGIYIGCNKAFESYIGLKAFELKGKSVYDIASKEMADIYKKADDELFASKGTQTYEAQVKYADGSVHDVVFNKAVFLTNKKYIGGMVGVMVDITDRKKAEQEKKELEAKLYRSQKLEAIGTLAGGIAHDFNNILSAIFGYTELAIIKNINNPLLEKNLLQIHKAAERAKDLVKQILAVARQSDNVMSLISVPLIVNEALKLMRASLPNTIEIKKRIESESFIMGDPTQVHQIIMNLCSNAAQATEDKEGLIEINVSDIVLTTALKNEFFELNPGSYVELTISDNGAGIPNDIIKSIFEPYFTTKNPGEGTGLGLAIVHGIVKAHGGEIKVDSLLNKGSKFTVYFPISNKKSKKLSYDEEILPTGNEHILFVDDEAEIADINKQFLEKLGYSAYVYTNSIEALEFFLADPNKVDLVITDMTMPKMTGDVLAEKLKGIRPDIPIIICTGYNKKISDKLADQIGIDAVCNKPLSIKDLAKTIRNVLK